MTYNDEALIEEFVTESQEHLADIENQLLQIEVAGEDLDVELVNTVFRAVHSVKGAAGFLGFSTLGSLAHSLENVLNLMRNRELVVTPPGIDVLLMAADSLSTLLADVNGSNDVDVSGHVEALDVIAEGSADPISESPMEPDTRDEIRGPGLRPANDVENIAGYKPAPPLDLPPVVAATPDKNIRVSVESLDRLMNLAGELVLSRNQLMQSVSTKEKKRRRRGCRPRRSGNQ